MDESMMMDESIMQDESSDDDDDKNTQPAKQELVKGPSINDLMRQSLMSGESSTLKKPRQIRQIRSEVVAPKTESKPMTRQQAMLEKLAKAVTLYKENADDSSDEEDDDDSSDY